MILGITGHRPQKIGGFDFKHPKRIAIRNLILEKIKTLSPTCIITGMALGVDQDAASIALELNIPFIAAVPFETQDSRWIDSSKALYANLLDKAQKVIIVSEGTYSPEKFYLRDQYIVDNSDEMLAVWNGLPKSGTYNTIKYAKSQNSIIHYIKV